MNSELRIKRKQIAFSEYQSILLPIGSKIIDFTFIDKKPYIVYLYEYEKENEVEKVGLFIGKIMEYSSLFIGDIEKLQYVNYAMIEMTSYYLFIQK